MPHHDIGPPGLSCASGPSVLVSEFYPAALCGDEYVAVSSMSSEPVSLEGWCLSDGEGNVTFLPGAYILPSETLVASFNSTSYLAAFGSYPEIALDGPTPSSFAALTGAFRLADDGDSITLFSGPGVVEDFVVYGACSEGADAWEGSPVPALKQGEVARRIAPSGVFADSDRALDWMPFREYRYGYTDLPRSTDTVPAGGLVAFTSPDCSLDAVTAEIGSATRSVKVCVYEMSSSSVCGALLSALGRGVSVDVLVEGSPAGGMDDRQVACLSVLASAGASVRTVSGRLSEDVVRHVFALHSKYIVVDGIRSVVLSENLVESGVPTDRLFGNRGWGVAFTSTKLGAYLSALFDEDSRRSRPDIVDWTCDPRFDPSAVLPEPPGTAHPAGMIDAMRSSQECTVTLVPSPDGSPVDPFLVAPLREGRSVRVEQFQADLEWESRWSGASSVNPLLGALLESLGAGGSAEALFDSSWFNIDRNEPVVGYLREESAEAGLDGEFELLDEASPVTVLHNKGLIIDSRVSMVSSNNWVSASFARNRELAAFVDSPEVASYFARAFDLDWIPDVTPPVVWLTVPEIVPVGEAIIFDGRACVDDRAVANISWDIRSDGVVDAWGTCCTVAATVPGEIRVTVIVEDCWGNRAYKDAVAEAMLRYEDDENPGDASGLALSWAVPLAVGAALLLPRLLRRRRVKRSAVSKINQSRGGSHR